MKCPACGIENVAGTPLCRQCGATLPVAKEPEAPHAQNGNTGLGAGYGLATAGADETPAVEGADAVREQAAAAFAWVKEVHTLAAVGQKIEAIKLFREHTGAGLKEAKDAVEAMEQGKPIAITTMRVATDPQSLGQVLELLKAGNKIEAIKVVRGETGQDLATAKAFVEAMLKGQSGTQISIGSGTRKANGAGVLIAAVLVAIAGFIIWTLLR